MSGNRKWTAAAVAAGVLALAALTGCGGEKKEAGEGAAAPREARQEPAHQHGHDHGSHGAPAPAPGADAGHQHGTAHGDHQAAEEETHADHSAMGHRAGQHAGHGAPPGSRPAAGGHDHAGHSQPAAPAHDHGAARPAAPAHDHAGHGVETPSRPLAELPEQPAGILRPDALDAPAATSVLDAQRVAAMSQAMTGGHAGHGSGTYRHVDAGREADSAEPPHHDHGRNDHERNDHERREE